ncbi:MAG: hypothetical protein ACYC91_04670 [Solirubrobacteraceae bacterium]
MFHVELRQFPHVARAFNLSVEEIEGPILRPLAAGTVVRWNDRQWSPEKLKLTIFEGARLRPDELGQGRGWQNAARTGEDVTERLLERVKARAPGGSAPDEALEAFKAEVCRRSATEEMTVAGTLAAASEQFPGWRLSDRVALCERAIWELLHQGELKLLRAAGIEFGSENWEAILLDLSTWETPGREVRLGPGGP